MGSRAKAYAKLIGKGGDLTPYEKVQKWFEITNTEGYEVYNLLCV